MAIIKEIGTISVLGEVQSGTSQQGNPWCRQTIVVDVAEELLCMLFDEDGNFFV